MAIKNSLTFLAVFIIVVISVMIIADSRKAGPDKPKSAQDE